MAESPSHKFGQIIGDTLEAAILTLLASFAIKRRLYLDHKGPRPCRKGLACSWVDLHGNTHDLDSVLESGGTSHKKGAPVAFIEIAWRRYTKHARNKAQEIQGAIEPLAETYSSLGTFKGAVLAGGFTDGAIDQLKSLGFTVLFFTYDLIISAFEVVGIDAFYDENTPDRECQRKVDKWNRLTKLDKEKIPKELLKRNRSNIERFMVSLESSVARKVDRITIIPLHGDSFEVKKVNDAVKFIESYVENIAPCKFERYEIQIRFNNGNEINGKFNDKISAIEFLCIYKPARTSA
jgi:hypothetical protein